MKRTSKMKKAWKKEMVKRWEKLVLLYKSTRASPSAKRWGKLIFETSKFLFSVLLKKAIVHFLKDF